MFLAQGAGPTSHSAATGRGAFAFNYSAKPSAAELRWLSRFRVVVTGDALEPSLTADLRQDTDTLCFYHWATGLYARGYGQSDVSRGWHDRLMKQGNDWLLNANRPLIGPDGTTPAFYFDPNHADGNAAWANFLARLRRNHRFEGIFLDLLGMDHLHPEALQQYQKKHPETPYMEALENRIAMLRRCDPGAVLFSNQAYRHPELMRFVDWDLTESLMTSYAWGREVTLRIGGGDPESRTETYFRPWAELVPILDELQSKANRVKPGIRILHLNYLNPSYRLSDGGDVGRPGKTPCYEEVPDREAIYYAHATAKLWGHENFMLCPMGQQFASDHVFFVELGEPLGGREASGGLVYRLFARGVVVVNTGVPAEHLQIDRTRLPNEVRAYWDCFARRAIGLAPLVPPTIAAVSKQMHPSGRVFLYRI